MKTSNRTMKTTAILTLALAAAAIAQDEPAPPDPTKASAKMKVALMGGSAVPEMTVKGIVLGGVREGGALVLELAGGGRVQARPGVPFTVVAGGEARKLLVKQISGDGIEVEAVAQKESILLPGVGAVQGVRNGVPSEVEYVEFRDLPLLDALRLLGDQTGQNFSASVDANKIAVNLTLRGVSASSVVEEVCKSHGLWFKRDERSRITRIMTVAEFEKDLTGFREEQTEVFTLKYPNVVEVAFAIADLYGDRVQFSLGTEESDDDMRRDLEGRFDRFDVLTQRTLQSNAISGNVLGSNVNGFYSNGNTFSGLGTNSYGSQNRSGSTGGRYSNRQQNRQPIMQDEELFRGLTPSQAQRVTDAIEGGRRSGQSAAEIEALRKRPASIYVTASRRNNQVAVRTADARAMEDIRVLVKRFDVQTPLVLLEVKVVRIELGKDFRSAFDFQFSDGSTQASFSRENISLPLGGGAIGGAGLNSSDMTFVVVNNNFRARMQLFEEKNRVKNVATPTLLTANNEVSRLFLGEERPLVRNINSQTIITDNNVATTPNTTTEFRNVGNTLLITPNINSDRTVTLRLVQENSFINANAASIPVVTNSNTGSTSVQEVKVDTVGTRSISGTFVAKDGMMVAAGGLIEDGSRDKRSQIPVLGDIPGVGFFFRRQEISKPRSEMVVLIRPYVLTTPADGERISRDMLDRLAPASIKRLVGGGFLPSMTPPPAAKIVRRPPPSAAATKKVDPEPDSAPAQKKPSPFLRKSSGR